MRAPPPVEYASALTRTWRAVLSLLVAASVASFVAWLLPCIGAFGADGRLTDGLARWTDPVFAGWVAFGFGVLIGSAAWRSGKSGAASARTVRWDGQDWWLLDDAGDSPQQRGDAALMLDLGAWMLVRFAPSANGSARWLPLTLAGDHARWAALRGALWNWRADRGEARP